MEVDLSLNVVSLLPRKICYFPSKRKVIRQIRIIPGRKGEMVEIYLETRDILSPISKTKAAEALRTYVTMLIERVSRRKVN